MASNFNVKMGVEGISQFKQAMNQGRTAVKSLSQELKLNAAQTKLFGESEERLRERTELLNKQIAEQAKIVKAAEEALDKMREAGDENTTEFQKMSDALVRSKIELVKMVDAATNGTDVLEEGADKADKMADALASIDKKVTFNTLINGLRSVKDLVGSVISGIKNVATGVWNFELDATEWADDLATRAAQGRITTDTLQQMEYAANFMEVSADTILSAQNKLLSLKSENGLYKISDTWGFTSNADNALDLFWDAIEAVGMLNSEMEQSQAAQAIFGKSWDELKTLFGNRKDYNAFMQEALDKGFVISEEDVGRLNKANDSWQVLNATIESTKKEIAADFAEPFEAVVEALTQILEKIKGFIESPEGQALINSITDSITKFAQEFDTEAFVRGIGEALETIKKIAQFFGIIEGEERPNASNGFMISKGYAMPKAWGMNEAFAGDLQLAEAEWNKLSTDTQEHIWDLADEQMEALINGMLSKADAMYTTGQALANQAVAGASNGGGGSNYYTTNFNVDTFNNTSGTDEQTLLQMIDYERGRTNAGYGN